MVEITNVLLLSGQQYYNCAVQFSMLRAKNKPNTEQCSFVLFSFAKWAGNLKDEIFPGLNTSAAEQVFIII